MNAGFVFSPPRIFARNSEICSPSVVSSATGALPRQGGGFKVTTMAFVAVVSVVYEAECFATPLPGEFEIVGPEGAFHGEVSDERAGGPVSWDQAQQDARTLLEARKARRTEAVGPSAVDSSKGWRSTVADWAKDEAKVKYPW